jgi:hypothetical protein
VPEHCCQIAKVEITTKTLTTKTLWSGGRGARWPVRGAARADRAAARAAAGRIGAVAASGGVRLARRGAVAVRRVARIAKHDKDAMDRACRAPASMGRAAWRARGGGAGPGVGAAGVGGRGWPAARGRVGRGGGGPVMGKIAQRPSGQASEGVSRGKRPGGGVGIGWAGAGGSTLTLDAPRLDLSCEGVRAGERCRTHVAKPGTWQAVLATSNAAARKRA